MVGGGWAGMHAALAAADAGAEVVLIDEQTELGGHVRHDPDLAPGDLPAVIERVKTHARIKVLQETLNFGLYEGHYLAAQRAQRMYRMRAGQVIVATGGWERPFVFENNDRPGILLASAVQRLIHLDRCRLDGPAVIVTDNPQGYRVARQLANAGTPIAAVVDLQESPSGSAEGLPGTGKMILSLRDDARHRSGDRVGSERGGTGDRPLPVDRGGDRIQSGDLAALSSRLRWYMIQSLIILVSKPMPRVCSRQGR
ncbi:MAG: FAD/NAD(P)-binding oxidoreductase [Planctomycetaceae bacterium]